MEKQSIRPVNLVYLISMLLVVNLGSFMQTQDFGWGLIATEILLILLPALIYWRSRKPAEKVELGFKRISIPLALICIVTGIGLWLFDSLIDAILIGMTGYNIPAGSGTDTISPLQAIIVFIGFALAAPLCEEILFRGVIQSEYMRRFRTITAIAIPALLFAFFHLRLQGLPALLPVAFAISYVFWRTGSLFATILIHFGNNLMAGLLILAKGFSITLPVQLPSIPAAAIGLVLVIVCLFLIRHISRPTQMDLPVPGKQGLKAFWPLLIAGIIYLGIAGYEATSYFNRELQITSVPWKEPLTLRYEIQHKGDEPVGEAICRIEPAADRVTLHCDKSNKAFELSTGSSFYSSTDTTSQVDVIWDGTMMLQQISVENQYNPGDSFWSVEPFENQLQISVQSFNAESESLLFDKNALVEEEWPWRLSGMPFQSGIYRIELVAPLNWREELKSSGPVLSESMMVVSGPEVIQSPAGEFNAWRVTLTNGQTCWYGVDAPHHLIRYEGQMYNYLLTESTNK